MSSFFARKIRFYSTRPYEIPERYKNSFYLANAALFDQVGWFLHRAYEFCFSKLVSNLQENENLTEKQAGKKLQTTISMLEQCNSLIDVRFPIQRDNGDREIIRGFRAHHGLFSTFGKCLGGLRLCEDITRDHMKGLSAISTYKHACMGIKLAGGHGGLKINPKNYSNLELQRIIKKFSAELYAKGYCDGHSDIIEPDINTSEQEMLWISSIFPDNYNKVVTVGKPGGIENSSKMGGQSIFFALDYFLQQENILETIGLKSPGLENKTFIIQGLGKLGESLSVCLQKHGAICVGIKEINSYVYDHHGIDVIGALNHWKKFHSFATFGKGKPGTSDDIFKEPCDLLILAAKQKSLICYIADKVKAKVIVEASNCAITPTSHRILIGHSKLVLPDIYACSGYSIASYFEYLLNNRDETTLLRPLYQNILDSFAEMEHNTQVVSTATTQKILKGEMNPNVLTYGLEHVMVETGNELLEIAKDFQLGLDLRTAGYIKAIQTIHNCINLNK